MTSPTRRRPPMVSPRRADRRVDRRAGRGAVRAASGAGWTSHRRVLVVAIAAVAFVLIAAVAATALVPTRPSGPSSGAVAGAEARATVGPLPPCGSGETPTGRAEPADWAWTILDTDLTLPSDYAPTDLVSVREAGVTGSGRLRSFVIDDLRRLHEAAVAAGIRFAVKSAYRSFSQQAATFASLEKAYGRDFAEESAARPGHSEHQLGTTIDADGGEAWLTDNAWRFGFVQSYPVERSPRWTCYKPEVWHFRYFGPSTARGIHESGLSAREWLWIHQLDGSAGASR